MDALPLQSDVIFIELVTSDRTLKASIEGSKGKIYGTQNTLTIHDVKPVSDE